MSPTTRIATLVIAALALTACSADSTPTASSSASPAPSATASEPAAASASPSPSETAHEPFPDRPESTVEPWPDHGDFAVDVTKAITPALTLAQEQRWDDYDYMTRITSTSQARWIGSWSVNDAIRNYAHQVYTVAAETGRIGLISYYGMRDYTCEDTVNRPELAAEYAERATYLVEELPESGASAWIVLEPALMEDLGACEGDPRAQWVSGAAATLAQAGATVYLDAGVIEDADALAAQMADVDLTHVAGFAVNTNGYRATSEQVAAGEALLSALGAADLGLIVDTSRNGVPLDVDEPCNPPEAGIGTPPRLVDEGAVDAYVWIKRVGESDGSCNGGVARGQFDQRIALQLAKNGNLEEN